MLKSPEDVARGRVRKALRADKAEPRKAANEIVSAVRWLGFGRHHVAEAIQVDKGTVRLVLRRKGRDGGADLDLGEAS